MFWFSYFNSKRYIFQHIYLYYSFRHFVFVCSLIILFFNKCLYCVCVFLCLLSKRQQKWNSMSPALKMALCMAGDLFFFFSLLIVGVFNVSFICWRFEWEKRTRCMIRWFCYICVPVSFLFSSFSTAFFWIRLKYAVGKLHDTF